MDKQTDTDQQNSRFELKTVLETSRMLIESRSPDFVLDNLLLIIMGKLLVSSTAILFYDPESTGYSIIKKKGSVRLPEGPVDIDESKVNIQQPYVLYDEEPGLFPNLTDNMEGSLFFNLRTSNRHIGFLFIGRRPNGKKLQEHELEFVESLTIISASAIANSRMFDELKTTNRNLDQRIHELNTLFDLSKEFNLLTDREKISRIFKFALLGQLFVRSFFLLYKSEDSITPLASSNLKSAINDEISEAVFYAANDVTPVDTALAEKIPFLEENNISTLLDISIQNDKVAVIGVGKRANEKPFSESDFNFLKSLANLAINAIQKTYLIEERIEKERMEEELSIAKSIQIGLLPDPIPNVEGLDLSAVTKSSSEVGGDYFDIAQTPDGNHVFAIADVTGKGVPAALLMANLQSMLHVLLPVDITLAAASERINNLIFKNTPADKFITFFWGKYFHKKRVFSYVNAGHNPPLYLPADSSEFQELSEGGLLLGAIKATAPYEQDKIELKSGDIVVCYTDGVNESLNKDETEEYGEERLKECILANRKESAKTIQQSIVSDVYQFSNNKQYDDITLLIFKVD